MSITVEGREISEEAIATETQNHPAETLSDARAQAAEALVVRELLLAEAERQGLVPEPQPLADGKRETDEDALIRQLLAREIAVPELDETMLRRYYDNNRGKFRTPDTYRAAHIFFPAPPGDTEVRTQAEIQANEAIAELQTEPDRFAELARARSHCTSASDGGDLGWVARGQTVSEFESFLDALEPGQLCPAPVPTRYGIHVVRLDDRRSGEDLAFEAVRERIAHYLRSQSWNRAVAQYISILAGRADIRGLDIAAASSPLVQ
ncbi:peptidyl-prolyl cis-trans isomerase C [Limimonas halophila]|uniref:Parvulin-like PPIase n=1 Tax=Limimonas halophila TaxID=1082479 RepID=A0A1G7NS64_9PROT|nr:peptidylprolyl isomerase [Limimonas halophila]SDF76139.1 peptidyl-prolyl cis-trans isomerase C [Limimonas halophila]